MFQIMLILVMPLWVGLVSRISHFMDRGIPLPIISGPFNLTITPIRPFGATSVRPLGPTYSRLTKVLRTGKGGWPIAPSPQVARVILRTREEIFREAGTPCLMGIGLWMKIRGVITTLAGMVGMDDSDLLQEILSVEIRNLTMGSIQST
jgi:hypothetical protein